MHFMLLTQYAIIMVQFLARLRKIKLQAGYNQISYVLHFIWEIIGIHHQFALNRLSIQNDVSSRGSVSNTLGLPT